jgi:hypothetical protein
MRIKLAYLACAFLVPCAASTAERSYQVETFDKVSVAAGIQVHIMPGSTRSAVARTSAENFEDLKIIVKDGELRISRPARNWFFFGRRPNYSVQVVMPVLRSLNASSGSQVMVKGQFAGDFALESSSGSQVDVAQLTGGKVRTRSSSGSQITLAGSCQSLDAETSSGADLDAGRLMCETVAVRASSGSGADVAATRALTAKASSGAGVKVSGAPEVVEVKTSSGGRVKGHKPKG